MRRSIKNYFCILALFFSLYLMGWTVLKAHEVKTYEQEVNQIADYQVSTGWYVASGLEGTLFGCLLIYLIVSKGNEKSFSQTLSSLGPKSSLIGGAAGGFAMGLGCSVWLVGALPKITLPVMEPSSQTAMAVESEKTEDKSEENYTFPIPELPEVKPVVNLSDQASGYNTVTETEEISGAYTSETPDENTVLVKSGGQATLISADISKTGDAASAGNAKAYGLNAAILVQSDGTLSMLGGSASSFGEGSSVLVANGQSASASISDASLTSNGNYSPVLQASFQGLISGSSLNLKSVGNESPALEALMNSTISVSSAICQTTGLLSPILSGAGSLQLVGLNARADNSTIATLQQGAQVQIQSSSASASGETFVSEQGALIYLVNNPNTQKQLQTNLEMSNTTLSYNAESPYISTGSVFSLENTSARIALGANTFNYYSSRLIQSVNSRLQLEMAGQALTGVISLDADSSAAIYLNLSSSLYGAINPENECQDVDLSLDASSTLTLTADTYISSLTNEDTTNSNINFNGCTLYINGQPLN